MASDRASDLHDKARAAWPGVEVPRDLFAQWVEARVPPDISVSGVRAADLYLACACAQGNRAAIATFEASFFREVDIALRRMGAQIDVDQGACRLSHGDRHGVSGRGRPGAASAASDGSLSA